MGGAPERNPEQSLVAVIGAGVAGLQTLYALKRKGFNVVCLEGSSAIGGVWSRCEEGYGLQVSYDLYAFPSFPWPFQPSEYPSGPEVYRYIMSFVEANDLASHIRVGCRVDGMQQDPCSGTWSIVYTDLINGQEVQLSASYVVVCSGAWNDPFIPPFPGQAQFEGLQVHSKNFLDARAAVGKRLVIIGSGKGALDALAVALTTKAAARVVLLQRRLRWPFPRKLGKLGLRRLVYSRVTTAMMPPYYNAGAASRALHALASPVKRLFWRSLASAVRRHFRLKGHELAPAHSLMHDLMADGQVVDDMWPKLMRDKRVMRMTGEVASFTPCSVKLKDGREVQCDMILYCTGYNKSYDFLPDSVRAALDSTRMFLYRHMLHPDVPNLAFVGAEVNTYNNILTHGLQAEWLARVLEGSLVLPSPADMHADITRQQRWAGSAGVMESVAERNMSCNVMLYINSYHDLLCSDMGERTRRKGWKLIADCASGYTAKDYASVVTRTNTKARSKARSGVSPILRPVLQHPLQHTQQAAGPLYSSPLPTTSQDHPPVSPAPVPPPHAAPHAPISPEAVHKIGFQEAMNLSAPDADEEHTNRSSDYLRPSKAQSGRTDHSPPPPASRSPSGQLPATHPRPQSSHQALSTSSSIRSNGTMRFSERHNVVWDPHGVSSAQHAAPASADRPVRVSATQSTVGLGGSPAAAPQHEGSKGSLWSRVRESVAKLVNGGAVHEADLDPVAMKTNELLHTAPFASALMASVQQQELRSPSFRSTRTGRNLRSNSRASLHANSIEHPSRTPSVVTSILGPSRRVSMAQGHDVHEADWHHDGISSCASGHVHGHAPSPRITRDQAAVGSLSTSTSFNDHSMMNTHTTLAQQLESDRGHVHRDVYLLEDELMRTWLKTHIAAGGTSGEFILAPSVSKEVMKSRASSKMNTATTSAGDLASASLLGSSAAARLTAATSSVAERSTRSTVRSNSSHEVLLAPPPALTRIPSSRGASGDFTAVGSSNESLASKAGPGPRPALAQSKSFASRSRLGLESPADVARSHVSFTSSATSGEPRSRLPGIRREKSFQHLRTRMFPVRREASFGNGLPAATASPSAPHTARSPLSYDMGGMQRQDLLQPGVFADLVNTADVWRAGAGGGEKDMDGQQPWLVPVTMAERARANIDKMTDNVASIIKAAQQRGPRHPEEGQDEPAEVLNFEDAPSRDDARSLSLKLVTKRSAGFALVSGSTDVMSLSLFVQARGTQGTDNDNDNDNSSTYNSQSALRDLAQG